MKKLNEILAGIDVLEIYGDISIDISEISIDSRNISPRSLFIAMKGTKSDGHLFIREAIKAGAIAVICSVMPESFVKGVTYIKVSDTSTAAGTAASNFFGNPSSRIILTGVTGTNGKTTIATLLYKLFTGLGYKSGLFSTVCNYVVDKKYPATHTTPDPVQLNRLLAEMVKNGCTHVFMEVSSHSVDQKRIHGLRYAGAIFTNLTHDHLDYHLTFENYRNAKKAFFDSLDADAFALVNADDRNSGIMVQNCKAAKYTFSTRGIADFRAAVIEQGLDGMQLRIDGKEVWTHLIGDFNASNLLAVYAASVLLGVDRMRALTILSGLLPVPGRLEIIKGHTGITGIVDYAHTPDALVNVIETINRIRQGKGKLITVVGAGGDRDRTKRPLMASICASGSDRVILTSDNPRSEDPDRIIDEMEAGLNDAQRPGVIRITDRREAIKTAVMLAENDDVILIAGKGHEPYQEIKGVRYHFDDREELSKALSEKK